MQVMKKDGWVEIICGSMFSGKSEELIRRVRRAKYGKLTIQVFKPAIDNRYSDDAVVSHNGDEVVAMPLKESKSILDHVRKETSVVAIDEVQFFDDGIIDVIDMLANDGKRVIAAGLDTDFRGEPFGPMPMLVTMAEFVTKLQAVCPVCGQPATRTQRLINGSPASYHDPIILVGASESYEPRCRHCHEVPDKPNRFIQKEKNPSFLSRINGQ